jgi:hypothetical protein
MKYCKYCGKDICFEINNKRWRHKQSELYRCNNGKVDYITGEFTATYDIKHDRKMKLNRIYDKV